MPNIHQENYVIIRVWTSSANEVRKGENVGHVSLETEKAYMSLWPTSEGKLEGVGFFKGITHEYKPNYQADLEAEQRKPEHTIVLYSLNPGDINEEFKHIQNRVTGWALIGGVLVLNGNSAESCASMAYKLLDAGGIYHLVSSVRSCTLSSSTSPDELARLVIDAKRKELQDYPQTEEFNIYGVKETGLPDENPKTGLVIGGSACIII